MPSSLPMFSLKSSLEEGEYSEFLVFAEHASWNHGQTSLLLLNEMHECSLNSEHLTPSPITYIFCFGRWCMIIQYLIAFSNRQLGIQLCLLFFSFFPSLSFMLFPSCSFTPPFSPFLLFFLLFISHVEGTKATATYLKTLSQ